MSLVAGFSHRQLSLLQLFGVGGKGRLKLGCDGLLQFGLVVLHHEEVMPVVIDDLSA